ncbi:hypothetical protein A2U01_0077926, partial [Trifolium medium]|nr:hypothetical protein [Trifolium medium]
MNNTDNSMDSWINELLTSDNPDTFNNLSGVPFTPLFDVSSPFGMSHLHLSMT